jgi:TRAP transporter 4TM/12TM fusion protein
MLGLGLVGAFIVAKPTLAARSDKVPWYDWVLAALSLLVAGYVAVGYPTLSADSASVAPQRWIMGALALLLICEATRRLMGWSLIIITVLFIAYARYADLFPGVMNLPPTAWDRIAVYIFLDTNGLFGVTLSVAATTIVSFVLLGAILTAVKGDRFVTDFALLIMGRYRGGSAKVSVVASTLFGTMSGSSVSNVAVVGPITIPLMRKGGYPRHMAGAVEAVASTGGQIMPPVMGITAFLIADYLSIPYGDVAMAALVPALLYYLAVFIQIDLEAARLGLAGIPAAQLPKWRSMLRFSLSFVVPVAVLIYTLVAVDWEPGPAGMAAVTAALAIGILRADTRPSLAQLWVAIVSTGRTMVDMLIMCAAAGVIIGALQVSGIGFNFSNILLGMGSGNVMSILLLTGFVSFVLGIPLPTAVIYTMLAVLVAPSLVQLGVNPLAAHLFLFYTGMLSALTPPVALSVFAAAAIAGSDLWRTGLHSMRLGIIAYIIPFVFPFSLGLLLQGAASDIVLSVATAVVGMFFMGWGLVGYIVQPIGWLSRALFIAAGLMVLPSPTGGSFGLYSNLAGFALAAVVAIAETLRFRRGRQLSGGT